MGFTIISKLTEDIYIIRESKSSIDTTDYIAYMPFPENQKPIKVLSIKEIKANVKRGVNKLIEPFLEDPKLDWNRDFDKILIFVFLLKVKLFLDYILKKGLDKMPLIKIISIKREKIGIAYQIASYLEENDRDTYIPEPYLKIILNPEVFPKIFKAIYEVTFRSNSHIVREAFLSFNNILDDYLLKTKASKS